MGFDDAACAVRKGGCVRGTVPNRGREEKFSFLTRIKTL